MNNHYLCGEPHGSKEQDAGCLSSPLTIGQLRASVPGWILQHGFRQTDGGLFSCLKVEQIPSGKTTCNACKAQLAEQVSVASKNRLDQVCLSLGRSGGFQCRCFQPPQLQAYCPCMQGLKSEVHRCWQSLHSGLRA